MEESLRIHDLPNEGRPREKALQHGLSSLSDAELLGLFIGTGMKGENAIQIGQRLLNSHGSLADIARLGIKQLSKQKGLGPAKSTLIAAACEIGARVAKQEVTRTPLVSPDLVYDLINPQISSKSTESVWVLVVDSKLKCLQQVEVSSGTVNQSICHPRDILHAVITHQAPGFILVHNHPSGDPQPSQADYSITETIRKAADIMHVKFHDHIIIGSPQAHTLPYYSFKEYGKL